MRSLHVSDGIMSWDGYDDLPVAALPVEFRMPDIERYTGIGCPRIHLHHFIHLPLEEKIAQIIDRPSERDQISMIMRSLQPRFARHLMGFPQTDFGSLVQALYGIEEGISRGLWQILPIRLKGKKPGSGPRPSDVGTIGMTGHRDYYLHPPPQPVYATQTPQRPPMQFHHQYRAPPPPMAYPPGFRTDLHCAYHQRAGHDTDSCSALRHAIQDLIDQGLVDLGRPGVATDPLPTHDTRAVPPPPEGVHLIEFAGDEIFMMGWDGEAPQPISLYEESDFVGYIPRQQIPRPFSLTPDKIYGPPPVSPVYLQHVPPMTPFILFPEEYRPLIEIGGSEEDDEILRQLRTTQARISIWSLLASSSTHRDALVRALGQIRVDTATTPEGLIHMLTADRATCIVFSDDDLPPEGSNHVRPLFIDVLFRPSGAVCSIGQRLCPERLSIGYCHCAWVFTMILGLLHRLLELMMGLRGQLWVLRIQSSFNLLLGRPWIHEAGAIPSSLHQKVKFIHEGRIITIQSDRDIITSSEPVLHISHSEDDLHLTGFTFDEVQVVSLEDGSRDMVPMSFDQHSSTLVLSMMRGMSYLPGMGLGRRQQGPHEFTFTVDHDTPYGLGYIPQRLMHVICHSCAGIGEGSHGIPFDYPLRPYTFQLADYFIRGSEHTPRTEGTVHIPETVEIQDIQQALGQIHLDTGTTEHLVP
ncbi:hypothetical protein CK203_055182 [Vitis vinifera]|uniref:G-patch domain-containing protein n=1 Tax=Vitis vinifera TaxID=29760 RepID=A0A438GHV6_VITVI|nr:hypothetical protein CK203_055182 [Vitis vinifera]